MPAKSKRQLKYIQMLRSNYKDAQSTPEDFKWIWDDDWDDVDYSKLPDKVDEDIFESFKTYSQNINVSKGINVFDVDDTLVVTRARIHITDANGKSFSITPQEYTTFKVKHGQTLDFKEFKDPEILMAGNLINWTFEILKRTYAKGKAVGIITARSDKDFIRDFFLGHGIDIHKELVYAVTDKNFMKKYKTTSVPELKMFAVKELIDDGGFKDITFFDDDIVNLKMIKLLEGDYEDVRITTKYIKEKWIPQLNENLSENDLKKIEFTADKYFNLLGLDITFTKHFKERINDRRNGKPITAEELNQIFNEIYINYGMQLRELNPDYEAVFKDISTDINAPFIIDYDKKRNQVRIIMKTIMRKERFLTPNDIYPIETDILEYKSNSYKVPAIQKELKIKYGDKIKIILLENDEILEITNIFINPDERGKGIFSDIMNNIIDYATNKGLIITLYPTDEFGTDKHQLIEMYKKYGFVLNSKLKDKRFDKDEMIKYTK